VFSPEPPLSGHSSEDIASIAEALNALLADVFALYVKTKSFHWHVAGPHFRDHHLMFDEQAAQLFAVTDVIAERVRKLGATTLRSISHIQRLQRIADNDTGQMTAAGMLAELLEDNRQIVDEMRACHRVCSNGGDIATTSVLETFIDEGERRAWFLLEASARS
jgi:starvation-inducible DNA-binding protein